MNRGCQPTIIGHRIAGDLSSNTRGLLLWISPSMFMDLNWPLQGQLTMMEPLESMVLIGRSCFKWHFFGSICVFWGVSECTVVVNPFQEWQVRYSITIDRTDHASAGVAGGEFATLEICREPECLLQRWSQSILALLLLWLFAPQFHSGGRGRCQWKVSGVMLPLVYIQFSSSGPKLPIWEQTPHSYGYVFTCQLPSGIYDYG